MRRQRISGTNERFVGGHSGRDVVRDSQKNASLSAASLLSCRPKRRLHGQIGSSNICQNRGDVPRRRVRQGLEKLLDVCGIFFRCDGLNASNKESLPFQLVDGEANRAGVDVSGAESTTSIRRFVTEVGHASRTISLSEGKNHDS